MSRDLSLTGVGEAAMRARNISGWRSVKDYAEKERRCPEVRCQ